MSKRNFSYSVTDETVISLYQYDGKRKVWRKIYISHTTSFYTDGKPTQIEAETDTLM